MTIQDTSAFSQILAVGPKMRHVVEQARKLAMLSAPLLIVGDTGTGKICWPTPAIWRARARGNLIWR